MIQPEQRARVAHFLEPITGAPKDRPFVVFDLESKHDDTQKKGFTRPFMVGFYNGKEYKAFRNLPIAQKLHWYERAVSRGGCIDQFMHLLLENGGKGKSRYAGYDVYAHNMGAFDGLFLPAWLERNNQHVSYKIMPVQSRIQAIEVWLHNKHRYRGDRESIKAADKADRKQYGVIRILDSFRIMPSALDKIAKAFGLEGKLKDFDLDTHEDDPIWEKYNEIDDVQLFKVIQKFKELIASLGGEVGITAPSTAIKLLRRKYLPSDKKIHRNIHFEACKDEACLGCAHDFVREAYYGGRTEVFQRKGTGYYYDVNSSYPYSMTLPAPVGEMYELDENEDFTRFARNENYIGFVRCTVEIPEETYLPPLPVQHEGKLKFPAGRFSGTWDWRELRVLGRIGGKILHVEKSVWFKGEKFLTGFVRDLYAMRKPGTPQYKGKALSEIAKLILNSTFGKFGMDQNRIEMVILKPGEPEPWELRMPGESVDHKNERKKAMEEGTSPSEKHRFHVSVPLPGESPEHFAARKAAEKKGDFENHRWRVPELHGAASGIYEHDSLVRIKDIRIDAAYIIPQIAAHITSNSRILLWSYMMDILDRNEEIFYGDTDSCLTSFGGYRETNELGGLKKEYQEQVTIECFAPKMYRLTKPTPFAGEHARRGGRQCVTLCPGCKKNEKGDFIKGEHEIAENGERNCLKSCPGCSCEKIMMKGFPRDLKTSETLEKLQRKEEISYIQHEKLGVLAKGGFRATPQMATIRKSIKSEYDKRIMDPRTGDTKPIVLDGIEFLSQRFRVIALEKSYKIPPWLIESVDIYENIRLH